MNRTYGLIEFRAVDDDKRIIEGIATTEDLALDGLILESDGINFKLPVPFLLHHDGRRPIGNVIDAKRTAKGIWVQVQIGPPGTADYIDEAWRIIKAGVIRGLSITWKTLKRTGNRITSSIWLELSAVSVPADMNATILSVRSADEAILAASGTRERPSVVRLNLNLPASGPTQGKAMKTIREHIAALKTKRDANDQKLDAILQKCATEERSRDQAEQEEFDNLQADQRALDADIKAFEDRESGLATRAAAVTPALNGDDPEKAGKEQRQGRASIEVRSLAPKGIGMARYAIAMVRSGNNPFVAPDVARKMWPDDPSVEMYMRAIIEAGDTTTSGWASQLVPAAVQLPNEFLELLRPATIIGRIPGLRRVPFNVAIPIETAGGTFGWVGEAAAKPVSALTFTNVTLRWAKAAGIVVITQELARFSNPSAEMIIRDSMIKSLARFFDQAFISTTAEVSNVSPAGILAGIGITSPGAATAAGFRTAFNDMLNNFTANSVPLDGIVVLMSSTQAVALSLMVTDLGVPLFPDINRNGGEILGFPVVISENVGTKIIGINANEILLAEDGAIRVDVSDQATIEMETTPAVGEQSPPTTQSVLKSMFQNNMIALRAEQFITWKVARASAVEYISPVAYLP